MQVDYDSLKYRSVSLDLPIAPVSVSMDVFSEGDLVSEAIVKNRIWEPYETQIILKCLGRSDSDPRKCLIDVGANIGYYSLVANKSCGAKVYAFEPEQRNFELLKRNLEEFEGVSLFNLALSDQNGSANLYLSTDNAGDHQLAKSNDRICQKVTLAKGDSLVKGSVDFIKIDTQGAEYKVLKGLMDTISANLSHLDLIVEFWPLGLERQGSSSDSLIELLTNLDLGIYIIDHQQHLLISARSEDLREFASVQKNQNLEGFINLFLTSGSVEGL